MPLLNRAISLALPLRRGRNLSSLRDETQRWYHASGIVQFERYLEMRNRFMSSIVAATVVLGLWHVSQARTAQQVGTAKTETATHIPDISGVWMERKFQPKIYLNGDPPLQPWAEAKFKAVDVMKDDPNLDCLPEGMPRVMYIPLPMEIIQIPGRVLIRQEAWNQFRQIFTDGRQHPKDLDPTFMGHSIGRYEADTLVVDTVGINERTWLDHVGLPHSDALHVVERIRRVDHNTLQDDFTIDDPKTFTKTWTAQQTYDLKPDWEIAEFVCENNKYKTQEKK
jgi:hypothetical protein